MKRKEVDFPKKQNVTFYEKDKELYYKIIELADKEGRAVQNYILQLLHQVIPLDEPSPSKVKIPVQVNQNIEVEESVEETQNINSCSETRNKLLSISGMATRSN
jgi:hypothetical protein